MPEHEPVRRGGPFLRRVESTETRWFNGDIYRLALTGEETGSTVGMVDAVIPPGGGPIVHIHEFADEHYLVIDGEIDFVLDDQEVTAKAGDSLHVPRGTRHAFHNSGIKPARLIFLFTPGGAERLFQLAGDAPTPGVQVQPWGPERLTPELLEQATALDTIVPSGA